MRFIAGRYTEAGEKGMYLLDLNMKSGTVKELSAAEAGPNPSYFCISEKKNLIYAANEVMEFDGAKGGGVTTLKYVPETRKHGEGLASCWCHLEDPVLYR